jgi:hypothetical protein
MSPVILGQARRDEVRQRSGRGWAAVVLVVIGLPACGGGSHTAATSETTTLPSGVVATTTAPDTTTPDTRATTTTTTGSTDAVTSTSCDNAPTQLADARSERVSAATAVTRLESVDVSTLVPRDPPSPDAQNEYLGGPPIGISSLPAGTVSEARNQLVPNGVEEGFIRGFRSPAQQTRVFYAVYRFATTSGAVNAGDAAINQSCRRHQDFLSTKTGVIGVRDSGPPEIIEMITVRNRLLFDFYTDGQTMSLPQVDRLALDFFARADTASPGPTGADAVARATASQVCGRLFLMMSVPPVDFPTSGEFRSTATEALGAIRNAAADPDAKAVADTLGTFIASIASRPTTFAAADAATEKAAAADNACRQLTGRGIFRS